MPHRIIDASSRAKLEEIQQSIEKIAGVYVPQLKAGMSEPQSSELLGTMQNVEDLLGCVVYELGVLLRESIDERPSPDLGAGQCAVPNGNSV
jgi:hypothetical protein